MVTVKRRFLQQGREHTNMKASCDDQKVGQHLQHRGLSVRNVPHHKKGQIIIRDFVEIKLLLGL